MSKIVKKMLVWLSTFESPSHRRFAKSFIGKQRK